MFTGEIIKAYLDGRDMLHIWGRGEAYTRFWWGKPEGMRLLGRPRRRWEDNNKMDLQEVGCGVRDWIELAQDRDR